MISFVISGNVPVPSVAAMEGHSALRPYFDKRGDKNNPLYPPCQGENYYPPDKGGRGVIFRAKSDCHFLQTFEVSPPTNRENREFSLSIASKIAGLRDFEKLGPFSR